MNTNQQLSGEIKKQIAEDLRNYISTMAGGSANKASKMLTGISNGYISLILNEKWESIADDTWRKLQKQVSQRDAWNFVPIKGSRKLFTLLADSKEYSSCYGIIANEGRGKTAGVETFCKENPNVFLVKCNEFETKKTFLLELMRVMGIEPDGYQVSGMMRHITASILKMDNPVIVWDEADKPSDSVLYFFISFYNMLEDKCGLMMQGTPHLENRIKNGVGKNRKGFRELWSRLGRKWIKIEDADKDEIAQICMANGLMDQQEISRIINQSEGDLRRVKRLVHAWKRKEEEGN
jgi:DNA transposition AAA+ family ATPase